MNTFLRLFYNSVKSLIKFVFGIFFSKIYVLNRKTLDFKNPCIPVSNHPNTLIDPFGFACRIKSLVFFLANAGMFESAFGNWFFSSTFCIPIKRNVDKGDRAVNNTDSFQKAIEHLTKGGSIYIAVQGGSEIMRRIGKVKTGAARIALNTEAANDFKLGLTILPGGIAYSDQHTFRSEMLVNAGNHISVADYKDLFRKDPREAVDQLTEDIKSALEDLIINTEDQVEEELLFKVEVLQQSENELPFDKKFQRSKTTLAQLRSWEQKEKKSWNTFQTKLTEYFNSIQSLKIKDKPIYNLGKGIQFGLFKKILLLIGFPIFLYGYVNNFLASHFSLLVLKKIKLYPGYTATIKVLASLISFPLFYSLQVWLVHDFFSNNIISLLYFISLPVSGLIAWYYKELFVSWKELKNVKKIYKTQSGLFIKNQKLRNEIMLLMKENMPLYSTKNKT